MRGRSDDLRGRQRGLPVLVGTQQVEEAVKAQVAVYQGYPLQQVLELGR